MIAAIRHVPFEGLGYIAGALEGAGLDYQYFDLFAGDPPPRVEDIEALVSMGGPMSANDRLDSLAAELELLNRVLAVRKPVLGICLGSQMLAKALGARVYPNAQKEIGWFPVAWQPDAAGDALFAGLARPETVFHWHSDTFDLPPGAAWLASSEATPHQAFRAAENAYGLQFHLEVTPAMIADWIDQDANCGDVGELEAPIDAQAHAGRQRELAREVFGRWARSLRITTRRGQ